MYDIWVLFIIAWVGPFTTNTKKNFFLTCFYWFQLPINHNFELVFHLCIYHVYLLSTSNWHIYPRLDQARECVACYKDTDMYAAMAYCNIGFMQAIMTFDRENIAQSLLDIDAAMQVCTLEYGYFMWQTYYDLSLLRL